MSKYEPLWRYIKDNQKLEYKLTYEEIRNILGFDIDHSFLKYKKELLEYGYEITKISIKGKFVLIHKYEFLSHTLIGQKFFYLFVLFLITFLYYLSY